MIIYNNHQDLRLINDEKIRELAFYFLSKFKSETTFELKVKPIKSNGELNKYDFQIRDREKKYIDFFGKHNTHEFALSLGKKAFTFYFRLYHKKFAAKQKFLNLEIIESKSQIKRHNSVGESYILVKTKEDIDELINFVFTKILNDNKIIKKPHQTWDEHKALQQKELEEVEKLSKKERIEKLALSNPIPEKITTIRTEYKRNPLVVIEVLERALDKCERCGNIAPFIKDSNNLPYLEVHHKIQLSNGGEDTIENAIALCPNCHRHAHFGKKTYNQIENK